MLLGWTSILVSCGHSSKKSVNPVVQFDQISRQGKSPSAPSDSLQKDSSFGATNAGSWYHSPDRTSLRSVSAGNRQTTPWFKGSTFCAKSICSSARCRSKENCSPSVCRAFLRPSWANSEGAGKTNRSVFSLACDGEKIVEHAEGYMVLISNVRRGKPATQEVHNHKDDQLPPLTCSQ